MGPGALHHRGFRLGLTLGNRDQVAILDPVDGVVSGVHVEHGRLEDQVSVYILVELEAGDGCDGSGDLALGHVLRLELIDIRQSSDVEVERLHLENIVYNNRLLPILGLEDRSGSADWVVQLLPQSPIDLPEVVEVEAVSLRHRRIQGGHCGFETLFFLRIPPEAQVSLLLVVEYRPVDAVHPQPAGSLSPPAGPPLSGVGKEGVLVVRVVRINIGSLAEHEVGAIGSAECRPHQGVDDRVRSHRGEPVAVQPGLYE